MRKIVRKLPYLLVALALGLWVGLVAAQSLTAYKSPTCGCCGNWIEHIRRAGITVDVRNVRDVSLIKNMQGIPPQLRSCHTGFIDGYLIEGHVPAADVLRLLEQRPPVAGLAVPGMPVGSPGMEVGTPQPYSVFAIDHTGRLSEFATHGN